MIVVTGGAGLIGSAVIWHLNQLGRDDIVVVDHLSKSEKWLNLRPLRFFDYYEKDHFQQLMTQDALPYREQIRTIIHLGACSDTTEVDAGYLVQNNFAYSKMLAEFAARNGLRMVYASSAATYGDGENGFLDDDRSLSKLRPLNKYGYSKQLFDQWLLQRGWLSQRLLSGASFVGLKYSNVFGPNEYHKAHMRSMVLRSFEQITATGVVKLFKSYRPEYADGEQVRDFLYVKDAAAMTVFFADAGYAACGLHNIGFGSVRSWNDLARATFAALKRPVRIEYIEMPEELRNRYQYYTCLDISKLRKAGYTAPLTTLEAAIEDTCAYLVDRRHLGE
ncbi:MAG: ADP-glyceromanno-heptose 6-epimerase [Lentisphaerae bacterium]|nr:ADP-glyceromanno-heptose 6-epimerase [Lentisphaerota bacterium]